MEQLNGILCINKPQKFTSFDVVAKLRGILGIKRIGHAGTLDPMATGVLPIFIGTATKACDMLPDNDKKYIAGFTFGYRTDTQDIWGKKILSSDVNNVTANDIVNALNAFTGEIMQIPPMYSAVSVNGQRLYDLARKGIEIERNPRPITVYEINLLSYDEHTLSGSLEISCSKGTYIRTLIDDIAVSLGTLGVMASLIRTHASGFSLDDCISIDEIQKIKEQNGSFFENITAVEKVFSHLPKIFLDETQTVLYKNGVKLDTERIENFPSDCPYGNYAVIGENVFLGTAIIDTETKTLRVQKNF